MGFNSGFKGLIGMANHPDMQKIRTIGFFYENRLHWQLEVENISTNGCIRLNIYLHTNKTLSVLLMSGCDLIYTVFLTTVLGPWIRCF